VQAILQRAEIVNVLIR